jgi:hypothetical protein
MAQPPEREERGMDAPGVRGRFWIEVVLAGIGVVLAVVTALVPDWIERLGGEGADAGGGGTERAVALLFVVAAGVFALLARVEWRRSARPAPAGAGAGGDGG